MTNTNEAVRRVEEFFDGFIPHEKIHNHGLLPHNRSSLDVDDVRTLLAALEASRSEIARMRAAIEEIDHAASPEQGIMAWVHDRTQKALKGGAS